MWSFCHSFIHSVNRISDEHGNGRRPNLAGTDKRWPHRSDWLGGDPDLPMDSGSLYHFLHHWGIGNFQTFVIFFVFSILIQSTADLYHTWRNDWRRRDNASTILGRFRQTSGSRLIRIRIPDHFCFKFWRWRRFALSITDRTSLISKIQNVWSHWFSKCRRL